MKREIIAKGDINADNMEVVRDSRPFAKLISRNAKLSQKARLMLIIWKVFAIRDHLRSSFREMRNYRKRRHVRNEES